MRPRCSHTRFHHTRTDSAPGHRILYQRAIYPPEDFKLVKKYGLTLLTTVDDNLERYLKTIVDQIRCELTTSRSAPCCMRKALT